MGRPTLPDAKDNTPRLYNLDKEIDEKTNLAKDHPEIVKELTALAEKMNAEIGGDKPTARRPAGKVANPVFLYPSEGRDRGAKAKQPERKKKAE
jgi:hypothetical protein